MRILLDTNILIHRETHNVVRDDIGHLFYWLDRMNAEKCVHPDSIREILGHRDQRLVESFRIKLQSYNQLRTIAQDPPEITRIRQSDRTPNDSIDTNLIREVFVGRVDLLITEDLGIHRKANILGITGKVQKICDFIEASEAEYPDLIEYSVLSIKKEYFGNININDPFFDSLKNDYKEFESWFNSKSDEVAYICLSQENSLMAFLYLKREDPEEPYPNISPVFAPKVRLKVGTFKANMFGSKIGERFIKIIFDNALRQRCDEIYLTTFENTTPQKCLCNFIKKWGFEKHGKKASHNGEESVFTRSMRVMPSFENPLLTYPFMSRNARKFIVPIYPEYHTELLPDSILKTESPKDFADNRPNRNAVKKAYISRSIFSDLIPGDIIVFYRTKSGPSPAHHSAVATTLGIVNKVIKDIRDFRNFRKACAGVSVFSESELLRHWDYNPRNRPFVVHFLYTYSLPKRPTLGQMKNAGVLIDYPRGFEPLSDYGFNRLLEISNAEDCPIID